MKLEEKRKREMTNAVFTLFFKKKTYILLIFTKISWITWEEKGLKYISNWIYIEKDIWAKSYVESHAYVSESENNKNSFIIFRKYKAKMLCSERYSLRPK